MSLLNDASLVLIPSGYKEDKVYSIIPSSGAGDLDFVRGCDATRINPQGLVENTPWNLLNYSEDFSNAYWYKNQVTIATNNAIAPNGTLTADKMSASTTNGNYINEQTGFDLVCNRSIYAKAGNYSQITILWNNYNNGKFATFDLLNGTVSYGGSGITATIESVGNGWYRCITDGSANYPYLITLNGVGNNSISIGSYVYIWGAQLNIGSTAKPYFPTTDRLNVPRLDYSNGCPSLLLEKQSTNISNYVESGTGNINAATVIDGTNILGLKCFKITTNSGLYGDTPHIPTNIEFQAYSTYTISFYTDFNKLTGSSITCSVLGFFPAVAYVGIIISKSNKAVSTTNVGSIWSLDSYSVTQIDQEIYKIVLTVTPTVTSLGGSRTYIFSSDNSTNVEFAGVQVEASSYPTSFITKPTGSSATRLADSCYKTGISSLIGQTSGSMFCEFNYYDNISGSMELVPMYIGAGAYSDGIYFDIYQDVLYLAIWVSASQQTLINCGALNAGRHKVAVSYTANDIKVYLDGALAGSDNSASIPTMSQLNIGTAGSSTTIERYTFNQGLLFKRVLTSQEAISLTTL